MIVHDETMVARGEYDGMWTALLVGESNSGSREISIQITHVSPGGEQPLHAHPQDQCYYVLEGLGTVRISEEERPVRRGDAIFIPGGATHGIRNAGEGELSYLTANRAFGTQAEGRTWNIVP